jgi:hypothetical protein
MQGVKWNLLQGCPLRQPDDWSTPLLRRAQTYWRRESRPSPNFSNFEGICVTCNSGNSMPREGFLIEQEFAVVGGSSGLHRLCGSCPANAALEGVAGCSGWFYTWPYAVELDEKLRALAEDLELAGTLEQVFPSTALLWFAFWMDSPLSRAAMQLLVPLLQAFAERSLDGGAPTEFAASLHQFVRAMERALYFGLELRVELLPPGHTDFGRWTTFAHCPHCKAGASLHAQWGKIANDWLTCQMCGNEFDAATTTSRQRMPESERDEKLVELLGRERYREFAVGYLMAKHNSLEEATAKVNTHLAPPAPPSLALLEKRRLAREKMQTKRRFINTVLCAGFEHLKPDAPVEVEGRITSHYLLSVEEARLLFGRARQWGADVGSIVHYAPEQDLDEEYASCRDFASPEAALQDLLNRGCTAPFYVVAGVSDAAIEAWKLAQPSGQD